VNLDQAIKYWKQKLTDGKPINRVRVRRILDMEGAERRGFVIMRRISDKFESAGLKTVPDFQSAWIDALVSIELTEKRSDLVGEPDSHIRVGDDSDNPGLLGILTTQDGLGDPEGEMDSTNKTAAPVAEALNSPAGDAGVVEVAVVAQVDAIIRVSSIPSANRGVVSVLPTDPISKATTLMSFEGYSQLAIMQGQREVRGMITWESIAKRSMLTPEPTSVADCRIDAQVIDSDASLFDAFPTIEQFGYVLARSRDRTITGIVTSTDFAAELGQLSYGFMCLRTIEMLIRKKLHPVLTSVDLANLEEHSKARGESDPALLTFGENIRLLERDEIWNRLGLSIYKNEFLKRLSETRDVRNEVMHFGPDPLGTEQKKSLNQMEHFLRQIFV
jgi:predicted transcriptional regulator